MRVNSGEWKDRLVEELATYKPEQIVKAMVLVKSKQISRHGMDFVATSSDGITLYLTSAYRQSCTCAAGVHQMRCYHLCAATSLAVYGDDTKPLL